MLVDRVINPIVSSKGSPEGPMLASIYASERVPPEVKQMSSLLPDTLGIVLAGTEATANVLVAIMYHLLQNPEKLARLQAELCEKLPGDINEIEFQKLKGLRYLVSLVPNIAHSTGF